MPSSEHQVSAGEVIRFQAGDQDAFRAIYARYFDRVFAYLRLALANRQDAEDAVQEVFTSVFTALPSYELRPGKPFESWLFRLAHNRAIKTLTKHKPLYVEDPTDLVETPTAPPIDAAVLARLSAQDLMIFIQRMPLAQRQTVALRYILGLDLAETAQILGRSPGATRMLEHRAHAFLRKRLKALGHQPKGKEVATTRPEATQILRQAWVIRHRRFALK